MKNFHLSLTFIFVILFAVSCTAAPSKQPIDSPVSLVPVKACYSANSATMAPAWYALEKGLYKKYGLDVKLELIASGTTAVTALIAGEENLCFTAGSPIANVVAAGQDGVIIATLYNRHTSSLMVVPGIKTADDLKGKMVAITRAGSSSDTSTRTALKLLGLQPDKDVTLFATGGTETEIMLAMENGVASGGLFIPPNTLRARQKGFHELLDMGSANFPYLQTSLSTTRKYLKEHRSVALNFTKAIYEAIVRVKSDPSGTREVLVKYLALDIQKDGDILDEAYATLIKKYMENKPYPSIEAIQNLLAELVSSNPTVASLKPEDLIDLSILNELDSAGFFSQTFK